MISHGVISATADALEIVILSTSVSVATHDIRDSNERCNNHDLTRRSTTQGRSKITSRGQRGIQGFTTTVAGNEIRRVGRSQIDLI